MKMWIARDSCGLWLFCEEPIYDKFLQEWFTQKPCEFGCLPTECFPEVTFENSPMEVELKLIVECSQKLVSLGENLWGKEQELDKEMQEHQKLCDKIMAIQGIEPIEAEMEQIIHCPEDYIFKDENGNVINATKIVLEKKKKQYPKTYEECYKIMGVKLSDCYIQGYKSPLLEDLQELLICRDAYWKIAGEEMGLDKPWKPDWNDSELKWCMSYSGNYIEFDQYKSKHHTLAFPKPEMRDAFYENFKEEIKICKELL